MVCGKCDRGGGESLSPYISEVVSTKTPERGETVYVASAALAVCMARRGGDMKRGVCKTFFECGKVESYFVGALLRSKPLIFAAAFV